MWPTRTAPYFLCFLLFRQAYGAYYIDRADGYDALPSCAEVPVSSIVRDMVSGCGDGGKTTSYSCFCTASSDKFRQIIATAVAKRCNQSSIVVDSATQVFHAYCQLGQADEATDPAGITTTSDLVTSPTPTSPSIASSTSLSTNDPSTAKNGLSSGAIIALSVCVSLASIAAQAVAFVLWRRRRVSKTADGSGGPVFVEDGNPHVSPGVHGGIATHDKAELDPGVQSVSPVLHGITPTYEKAELDPENAVVEMPAPVTTTTYELQ